MCVYAAECRDKKKASDPLELELQAFVCGPLNTLAGNPTQGFYKGSVQS